MQGSCLILLISSKATYSFSNYQLVLVRILLVNSNRDPIQDREKKKSGGGDFIVGFRNSYYIADSLFLPFISHVFLVAK